MGIKQITDYEKELLEEFKQRIGRREPTAKEQLDFDKQVNEKRKQLLIEKIKKQNKGDA